jgi:hypothetical protein
MSQSDESTSSQTDNKLKNSKASKTILNSGRGIHKHRQTARLLESTAVGAKLPRERFVALPAPGKIFHLTIIFITKDIYDCRYTI